MISDGKPHPLKEDRMQVIERSTRRIDEDTVADIECELTVLEHDEEKGIVYVRMDHRAPQFETGRRAQHWTEGLPSV
jgi:hypothetical protein